MTARDRFTAYLKCPKCGRAGAARLSELDGYSFAFGKGNRTDVDFLPEGFKIVDGSSSLTSGIDLHCETCGVSAVTKDNKPHV